MPIVNDVRDAEVGVYSWGRLQKTRPCIPRFKFDVENFRDPAGQKQFKKPGLTGAAVEVRNWVSEDPRFSGLVEIAALHVVDALKDGRGKFCSIAFVDQHGKWIAPAVAEEVALYLSSRKGLKVSVHHYGLD